MTDKQKAAEFMGEAVISLMKRVLTKHDLAILEESHRMIQEAVAAERERCARVCEEISNSMYWLNNRKEIAEDCAAAIRYGRNNDQDL